jgi:hypothetical protein
VIFVVGGARERAVRWLGWLMADLGERGLWLTPERVAAYARSAMSDPPDLLVAAEPELLAVWAEPRLAATPAVLIDGTAERARALGCVGALPAAVERDRFVGGIERILARARPPRPGDDAP